MDKKENKNKGARSFFGSLKEKAALFVSGGAFDGGSPRERRDELSRQLDRAVRGLGAGAAAFLFARAALPFGAQPFGAALLCAAGGRTPFIYIGLCVSALFSPAPLAYFLMYSLGMLLRIGAGLWFAEGGERTMFREGTGLRIMAGVTMAFMIGVYRAVIGGFLYYDLFGCAMGLVAAPIAVLVFRIAIGKRGDTGSLRDMCMALTCAVGVWSLSGLTLLGFSLPAMAAFIATLYVSRECGMLRGGILGLLCGMAVGLVWAPLFAVAGLLSGLFWRVSTLAATVSALAAGVFYSVWAGGFASASSMAPDLLAASLVFAPLARFGILPKLPLYGAAAHTDGEEGAAEVVKKSRDGAISRFEAMQSAFGSLADVFRRMSDRVTRPSVSEIYERCEQVFDSYCSNCARHSLCWDSNMSDTADAVGILSRRLFEEGRVSPADIPEHTRRRCFRADAITADINAAYSARVERTLKENKAEVFASDYESVARLLGEALRANAEDYKLDERLTRRLRSSARCLDLPVCALAAYGTRRKNIVAGGVDLARVRAGAEDIRRSFEKVCGFPLSPPEFAVERDRVTMNISAARRYSCVYARAGASHEGEDINGDSVSFIENSQDYFYALLSDGMGSGREAALTSRLCGVFLTKMLRAGNSKSSALGMLNDLVRNKGLECFATVDLLEVDLISGDACFVKSGAAPSYVLRSGSLFRIEAGTIPIGITHELESEQISFSLMEDDVVVMLSDGVASDFEEALWVADMLTNDWHSGTSLSAMCERIVDGARERRAGADDVSVAMVRIEASI